MSNKIDPIIESIEQLTVLELSELVSSLEDTFGVVAAAPMMAAAPAAGDGESAAAEEKTAFNVVITASGDSKINVIKAVRELNSALGLKDAKELVDDTPATIVEGASKEDAEAAKSTLEEAGATVELQ